MRDHNDKNPKKATSPHPFKVKLTPGWGDGGKSLRANKGKLVNTTVVEDQDAVDAVAGAIINRITTQHPKLLRKYGLDKVEDAIESVAEFAGAYGLDEIGSSDVSNWTKQVIQDLESSAAAQTDEDIKGWKHAASDINKMRRSRAADSSTAKLVRLKKNGEESKLHDATSHHSNEGEAREKHNRMIKLNPGKHIAHNLYVNNQLVATLTESADTMLPFDAVDTVTVDVPLLLRMMEYAREDAQEDVDLHTVAEKMIELAKTGTLTMDHYDEIVGNVNQAEQVDESYGTYAAMPADEHLNYTKTKTVGDARVTVNASAPDIEQLQHMLKLAGLPADHLSIPQHSAVEVVPQVQVEPTSNDSSVSCDCEPESNYDYNRDVKYSTNKQTLLNYLKDKLNKSID